MCVCVCVCVGGGGGGGGGGNLVLRLPIRCVKNREHNVTQSGSGCFLKWAAHSSLTQLCLVCDRLSYSYSCTSLYINSHRFASFYNSPVWKCKFGDDKRSIETPAI